MKHNKPAPDIYLYALQQAQITPKQAVVFEDATTGLLAATGAGIDTVLVPDWVTPEPSMRQKATLVLSDLAKAIPLFQ